MASSTALMKAATTRRTVYALSNSSPVPDAHLKELVIQALRDVPSAFNSQTTRAVLVLKAEHQKLWDTISDVYKAALPADKFAHAKGRFDGFRQGYGTILFYEDTDRMREFQEKYKTYEDKFPQWSEQSSGMHQYLLWTALVQEGFGVNLQHYNPLIDQKLQGLYSVPDTWSLKAQMVFGKPEAGPALDPKTSDPIEQRFKVFGE